MAELAHVDTLAHAGEDVPALAVGEDGTVCVRRDKYAAKWWIGRALGSNQSFPIALAAVLNASDTAVCTIKGPASNQGDVEVFSLVSKSDQRFSAFPYSQAYNFYLSNAPIVNNLLFGSSFLEGWLKHTFYESAPGAISFQVANLTALANNVRIGLKGRRFLDENASTVEARRAAFLGTRIRPFWITTDSGPEVTLAAGATKTEFTLTIPSFGDFCAYRILDDSTSAGTINVDAEIIDGLTGYSLFDGPVPWREFVAAPTLAVTGGEGFFRASGIDSPGEISHLFSRSTKVILRLTNNDGVNPVTIRAGVYGSILGYDGAPGRNPNLADKARRDAARRAFPSPVRTLFGGRCG